MESYILITYLNDFIFCPRSIYFHNLHQNYNSLLYHNTSQLQGLSAHKSIDNKSYSTQSHILMGIEVYCEKYNLAGKIDCYDRKKKLLRERKKKIVQVYDGYIFQVYAQCFSLREMGHEVHAIELYSMDDNKTYSIQLPEHNPEKFSQFETLLQQIHTFNLNQPFVANENKCKKCIYASLCDYSTTC